MRDKKAKKAAAPVPPSSSKETLERLVAARVHQAGLADQLADLDVARLQEADTDPALLAHADAERHRVHALELTRRREVRELQVNREYDHVRREVDVEGTWARARTERVDRQVRRGIADAAHAAKDVEAVEGALDETRPATAATKLARWQERIVAGFLLFGAAGSVLSAVGIAHAIHSGTSAGWSGAIATAAILEVPSTALASFVIWAQGLLARLSRSEVSLQEEDGTTVRVDPLAALPGWTQTLAKRVVIGLLAFSVLVNLWGALWVGVGVWGALGAVGAVIAAASALLGWAYSLQSSAIIAANMASPGTLDVLEERRRVASGADIPWEAADTPAPTRAPVGENELSAVLEALLAHEDTRRQVVDVIADMETALTPFPNDPASLTDSGTGSARSDLRELPESSDSDETGSARPDQAKHELEPVEEPEDTDAGSAGPDQAEHESAPSNAPAVRAASEAADQRRTDALNLWDQGWCAQEIAAQMNRDKRTVRGYLTDQGVTTGDMDQRVRERVAAYIEHKGPQAQTRTMASDLNLTRSETKAARAALGLEHRNQ